MKEVFVEIKGFDGYFISNFGRILGKSGKILKTYENYKGYLKVGLVVSGKKSTVKKRVHRLVAQAFIPNPDNLPEVNHKDLNKQNNRVDNLEWVTGEENRKHYNNIKNTGKDGTIRCYSSTD